jgi:polygalacturonase
VTDDTAAIQVAIEAVPQIDLLPGVKAYDGSPLGGAVYFPSDVYRVTKTLTLRKGLRFHGAGPYARAE